MSLLRVSRPLTGIWVAAAVLAGCSTAHGPNGSQAIPPQVVSARHATSSGDLLYLVDNFGSDVQMYSYPGETPAGTLTGFVAPSGLCVDKSGDVYVTDLRGGDIVEYAHGSTTPITTLADANSGPYGCAIDAVTGDLAVANSYVPGNQNEHGNIAIYKHARGTPMTYDDYPATYYFYSCAYDAKGNLYADGSTPYENELVELTKGGDGLTRIALKRGSQWVWGGIQWDGQYLALQRYDRNHNAIYRIAISGSKGKIVSRVATLGPKFIGGFWIDGSTVIVPNGQRRTDQIGTWSYPVGGKAQTQLRVPGSDFIAAAISSAR
jgi:hypothetical protein